jgi:type IV pilus assembly protein PilV
MAHLETYASHRGFTLVEVMVTLFIIGIGALGVAGLQLAAMRGNQSAFVRSQATLAAYALVDRMRAEPAAFVDAKITTSDVLGSGTSSTDGTSTSVVQIVSIAGAASSDVATTSTASVTDSGATTAIAASEEAQSSFRAWAEELTALHLQSPEDQPLGELDCSADNDCNTGNCTITIRWDDSRGEDAALAPKGRGADALAFQLCARVPQ